MRRRIYRVLACGAFLYLCTPARSQTPARPAVLDREMAVREQPVSIRAPLAPESDPSHVFVWLNQYRIPVSIFENRTTSFSAGKDLPLDKYKVYLQVGAASFYAGELNLVASLDEQPSQIHALPLVAEVGRERRARWSIFGSGFAAATPSDIHVVINRAEHKVTWLNPDAVASLGRCDEASLAEALRAGNLKYNPISIYGVAKSSRELEICNVPVPDLGRLALTIRQGAAEPPAVEVRATPWSREEVLGMTTLATLGLAGLVYALMCFRGPHMIAGRAYRLRALLMDKATNTYSLSILQFLLWTLAAIFGYLYLAISKLFVQRLDAIPEVPDVLPGIVGIGLGAGTAIVAQAISLVRPKGSGDEIPSPSDLVTSGGTFAPDRVQMLVWTLVGVGIFIAGVVKLHPASINELPAVPNTLMALMGLSSAGYLGAKFARKPGPNILELNVSPAHAEPAGGLATVPAQVAATALSSLAQPLSTANQTLQALKASAAGLSAGSASVAPDSAKAALQGIASLEASVAAASGLMQGLGQGSSPDAISRLAELSASSYGAATLAAGEFDRLTGAGSVGAELARVGALLAQRAASAVEDLASATGQAVSLALRVRDQQAEQIRRDLRRTIEIRGQNLSPDAIFRVRVHGEEYDLPSRMLEMRDGRRSPEVVLRDESNPMFARTLRLTIIPSQLEPTDRATYNRMFGREAGEITFAILNPDGQRSVKTFTLPPGEAQRD